MARIHRIYAGGLSATTFSALVTVPATERWLIRSIMLYPTGTLTNDIVLSIGPAGSPLAVRHKTATQGQEVTDTTGMAMEPGDQLGCVIPTGDSWNIYVSGTKYPV